MLAARNRVFALLDELGILHRTLEHAPVFTVEEAEAVTGHLPGAHTKNLLLEDRKGGLWLLSCLADRRIRINAVARRLGAPRMSFAKPERLAEVLGVIPGAVSPFALVNDERRQVQPLLEDKLFSFDEVNFHPADNRATTTIASGDLLRFLEALGYRPILLDLEALGSDEG